MLQGAESLSEVLMNPKFDPGEEVTFDVPDYGSGRGHISAFYVHPSGDHLYAVYPKNPRVTKKYGYVCIIVKEENLISTPF